MRDWLAHRVAATPDAEALVAARSGRTWTYAELHDAADAMAGRLAGLGVEAGDHVCVAMRNRPQYVTLLHASMRLGTRLVPVSADLTPAELAPALDRADATVLVCDADTERTAVEATGAAEADAMTAAAEAADRPDPGTEPHPNPDRAADAANADETTETDDEDATNADEDNETDDPTRRDTARDEPGADAAVESPEHAEPSVPLVSVDEPQWERVAYLKSAPDGAVDPATWERSDPLAILFTSGSTGAPKPVVLTMGNVLSSAVASAFRLGVTPDDRYLATLSLHHTGGIMPLYRATLYGTSVVLRRSFDPGDAADDLRKYDVTGVSLVPTMLRRMLDARGTLSDSLRVVLLGGAPAPDELVERCHDYSVPVHPTYGMTETASQVTTASPDEAAADPGTVGRPQFWTDLTVRDEEGAVVPAGETGELVVDGPTVTPGYYGDREATDAAFGPGGLYTGDVGYRDEDGYLHVLNRVDDRIITGGENVDPGEVVSTLRDHPGVVDAAVAGVPDDEWGERVAALVVPVDGEAAPTADELESFCRDRLAPFKLPRTVRFRDALPRTDTGTVERPAVRDLLAAASEDDDETEDESPDPETETGAEAETDPAESGTDGADGRASSDPETDERGADGGTNDRTTDGDADDSGDASDEGSATDGTAPTDADDDEE
ncbi:class I adenylate-forming enzyme family protein [Candidatus Halobonum tyrrellensis]|uniref:O-succinylbenzoic acid--CoA ligase n=1 Tax=Candidatus Halobonum tyrrellensis G22 TaxID=1324957 RepID=V4HJH8_9EURY|nr:class I adenylate-forming enzyme family protein [Candidatus Halobonum tyrrellensis]ESP88074.1 O-succinylbenzoic acid--CoA ligase [Candidatus Halobonum tyrrellensis G22]